MNSRADATLAASTPRWSIDDMLVYRRAVRQFVEREFVPQQARWRAQHRPDVEAWTAAGRAGLLLADIPEKYGGGGGTFAHEIIVIEELARAGVPFGSNLQAIVAHHILQYGTEAQRSQWLPRLASGELVAAVAMTEPSAGSDLQGIHATARKDGDSYVINGQKTFISNGWHAGLICLAVKTNPNAPAMRALSMIMVETKSADRVQDAALAGYDVGPALDKAGMHAQDTHELFFRDVRVPAANLLGTEGRGLQQMMQQLPYERLAIAASAVASAERAVELTTAYAKDRMVGGKPLFDKQNARFKLAECKTECAISRTFIDHCIGRFIDGQLDDASSAMAKYRLTESQCRVIDECVQLHGGYGYMTEYPITRMWLDSRVQRIYGGTNEVMKELIAWSL